MFDLDPILNSPLDVSLEAPVLLVILVALEAVLSADNAVALAAIARGLPDGELQRRALNFGLVVAYVLRISLILTATWVIRYWQFELVGALYLLWLSFRYFFTPEQEDDNEEHHHRFHFQSLLQAIPIIAVTDLAFSLDSVTTAIAISDRLWLVLTGGTIGVIALRFLAGLFIRWLQEYVHLEDAGYITVSFVGFRLLMKVVADVSSFELVPPDWLMIAAVAGVFIWGFSKHYPVDEEETPSVEKTLATREESLEKK